jgi:cyclase
MNSDVCRSRRQVAIGLCLAPLSPGLLAQPVPTELDVDLVKTGLYLIRGGGCNSLLRLSAAGSVLVDGKLAGTYRALMSQIRRINKLSDLPLRAVIYTNHHDIHAGNHAQFVDAGLAVLAQSNALPRLGAAAPPPAPASAVALRRRTGAVFGFERRHDFNIGGVDIRLHHFGPAQTSDDSVVLFPDLRVAAVGELCPPGEPMPDFMNGGTLSGWGPVLDQVLKLDFDIAVPSAGPSMTRAELSSFKDRLETLTARAAALVRADVAQDRFLQQLATADLGWTMRLDAATISHLYAELARGT